MARNVLLTRCMTAVGRLGAGRGGGSAERWRLEVAWRAAGLLVILASLGCGARDEPLGPEDLEPFESPPQASGSSTSSDGAPSAGCVACEGQVECGHCLVQGESNTIRCSLGIHVPLPDCLHLDEWHRDQAGALYTCYYCP